MYADQDSAPRSIMASPWLKPDAAADTVAASAASPTPEEADVDIRNRPSRASPHPPQTDELMFSPAKAEMSGVNTTLVWVRNEARAAGLKRSPALMRPCAPKFQNANSRALIHIGLIPSSCASIPARPMLISSSSTLFSSPLSLLVIAKIGKNVAMLKHCRTKLRTLAAGGPSVAYTALSVTFSVPYRKATNSRMTRPCSFLDVVIVSAIVPILEARGWVAIIVAIRVASSLLSLPLVIRVSSRSRCWVPPLPPPLAASRRVV
mmetsp:Transcript_7105/g.17622  ORF Transcript_7105/g.17622 Transcript_7105/m.17622 type:complete len:263 (+) Transcript_7105:948-1736(+)